MPNVLLVSGEGSQRYGVPKWREPASRNFRQRGRRRQHIPFEIPGPELTTRLSLVLEVIYWRRFGHTPFDVSAESH